MFDRPVKRVTENGTKVYECPVCKLEYTGYPALSRKDNKTYICPMCGNIEAMQDYLKNRKA